MLANKGQRSTLRTNLQSFIQEHSQCCSQEGENWFNGFIFDCPHRSLLHWSYFYFFYLFFYIFKSPEDVTISPFDRQLQPYCYMQSCGRHFAIYQDFAVTFQILLYHPRTALIHQKSTASVWLVWNQMEGTFWCETHIVIICSSRKQMITYCFTDISGR